jgi:L-seryl-tRNA(Ser) seleniumtransferase
MRPDKVILAALAATLRLYRSGEAQAEIPIWRQIGAPVTSLEGRARAIAEAMSAVGVRAAPIESTVGGGSLPGQTLPSWAVAVDSAHPTELARTLRTGKPAVIGRIVDEALILDLRTVDPDDDQILSTTLRAALAATPGT